RPAELRRQPPVELFHAVSGDNAWADGVDSDARIGKRFCQPNREVDQCGFGCRVRRHKSQWFGCVSAGDLDNAAPVTLAHLRDKTLDEARRPTTLTLYRLSIASGVSSSQLPCV